MAREQSSKAIKILDGLIEGLTENERWKKFPPVEFSLDPDTVEAIGELRIQSDEHIDTLTKPWDITTLSPTVKLEESSDMAKQGYTEATYVQTGIAGDYVDSILRQLPLSEGRRRRLLEEAIYFRKDAGSLAIQRTYTLLEERLIPASPFESGFERSYIPLRFARISFEPREFPGVMVKIGDRRIGNPYRTLSISKRHN